jgi:hypothetical protein
MRTTKKIDAKIALKSSGLKAAEELTQSFFDYQCRPRSEGQRWI